MALNIHCYNCGHGWTIDDNKDKAVGPYEYIEARNGADGYGFKEETIVKYRNGRRGVQAVHCPNCNMQGPHQIEG